MSKSVGNVVDPQELINLYGVEYVRYFLTAEIRFGSDGDFRHELLGVRINSDLSNNIGNLLQRAMVMMEKHCHSRIPTPATNLREVDKALLLAVHSTLPVLRAHVDRQEMKEMCDAIVMNGYLANKYVQDEAPWNLVKSDDPEDRVRFETVVFVAVEVLRCTAIFLEAIMPFASNSMLDQMGVPENMRSFDSVNGGFLIPGTQIGKPIPVFPQLEFKKNTPEEKPVKIKSKQTPSALDVNLSRSYDSLDEIQLQLKISEVAARIRSLKADTTSAKMSKSEIKGSVDELNYLKGRYICTQRSNGSAVHINQ
jgi:methionyl-tRNA synthetase